MLTLDTVDAWIGMTPSFWTAPGLVPHFLTDVSRMSNLLCPLSFDGQAKEFWRGGVRVFECPSSQGGPSAIRRRISSYLTVARRLLKQSGFHVTDRTLWTESKVGITALPHLTKVFPSSEREVMEKSPARVA